MYKSFFKRLFDIVLATLIFIVASPVLLLVALAIKLDSPGPIIFKQSRIGKDGRTFTIYKFRSMSSDNDVYDFSKSDSVTKVGKFLRKSGIDELPQLLNVIKGDMSIVGPRPYLLEYGEFYTDQEMKRTDVLPGMIGPNACSCQRLSIFEKNKLDDEYVDNFSFKQDFSLVKELIVNCRNIFKSRESGSLGNKDSIQKEMILLQKKYNEYYEESATLDKQVIPEKDDVCYREKKYTGQDSSYLLKSDVEKAVVLQKCREKYLWFILGFNKCVII